MSRFKYKKQGYVSTEMRCSFCSKKGHRRYFCPSLRSDPPVGMDATHVDFVESLINLPTEDISIYASMSPLEVMDRVNERGALLNRGNPWETLSNPGPAPVQTRILEMYWRRRLYRTLSWLAYGFSSDSMRSLTN